MSDINADNEHDDDVGSLPPLVASSSSEADSDEEDYRQLDEEERKSSQSPESLFPSLFPGDAGSDLVASRYRPPSETRTSEGSGECDSGESDDMPELVASSSSESEDEEPPWARQWEPPRSPGPDQPTHAHAEILQDFHHHHILRPPSPSRGFRMQREQPNPPYFIGRGVPSIQREPPRASLARPLQSETTRHASPHAHRYSSYRWYWNSAPDAARDHETILDSNTSAARPAPGHHMGMRTIVQTVNPRAEHREVFLGGGEVDAQATNRARAGVRSLGLGPMEFMSSILGLAPPIRMQPDSQGFAEFGDLPFDPILQILQASFNLPPMRKPNVSAEALDSVLLVRMDKDDAKTSCPISSEVLNAGEWAARMPCGHYFGRDDLFKWLAINNTCPVCRYELPTDDIQYNTEKCLSVEKVVEACMHACQMGNDIIGRRMSSAREAVLQTMLDESWAALNISDEVLACAHEHDLVLSAAGRDGLLDCRATEPMGESEDTLASMPVQTVVEEGGNHVETEGTHDGLDDEFCGKVLIDVLLAHQEEIRQVLEQEAATWTTPCSSPRSSKSYALPPSPDSSKDDCPELEVDDCPELEVVHFISDSIHRGFLQVD